MAKTFRCVNIHEILIGQFVLNIFQLTGGMVVADNGGRPMHQRREKQISNLNQMLIALTLIKKLST